MSNKLLVAAPRAEDRLTLKTHLEAMGYEVTLVPDLATCREFMAQNSHELVLIMHVPGDMDGLTFFKQMPGQFKGGVILLTDDGTIEDAVKAMQCGALDFVNSPFDPEVLGLAIRRGLSTLQRLKKSVIVEKRPGRKRGGAREYTILTKSPLMERVLEKARSVAKSRATVLIQGESGTGKELLARFIHTESDRSNGPFVALNCAALPETLLESELFGHEKGAFSGAISRKLGRFELANGGTLLLDEITEMALALQAKLLRVLQEGEVDRLGGSVPIPIDVRVIATTNRDVLAAVRSGQFREDLYFRLNVIPLKIPSLKERKEDIVYLAEHFREEFTREYGKIGLEFASEVLEEFKARSWPGNIRELRNIVERGVLLAQGEKITLQDLFEEEILTGRGQNNEPSVSNLGEEIFNLSDLEREMVKKALAKTKGNRTHAAKLLGISVRTLRNKLAEYRQMGLVL